MTRLERWPGSNQAFFYSFHPNKMLADFYPHNSDDRFRGFTTCPPRLIDLLLGGRHISGRASLSPLHEPRRRRLVSSRPRVLLLQVGRLSDGRFCHFYLSIFCQKEVVLVVFAQKKVIWLRAGHLRLFFSFLYKEKWCYFWIFSIMKNVLWILYQVNLTGSGHFK